MWEPIIVSALMLIWGYWHTLFNLSNPSNLRSELAQKTTFALLLFLSAPFTFLGLVFMPTLLKLGIISLEFNNSVYVGLITGWFFIVGTFAIKRKEFPIWFGIKVIREGKATFLGWLLIISSSLILLIFFGLVRE